ncbi:hypothetical protein ASG28_11905 [Frigoribacterium sp. Leaf415]|nr:hypothetical protein ASF07_11895 [Frigoribacterium sp. Leaf254]KQT40156.1 hypothetical protein ASG28_11905 [Frigoribacterium sp. Leaf415]
MLVTMKQNVLERTTESPRRKRNRTLGLGLGLAALLAIGGGSGALALGMLPSPFQASAPATPTSTPTPTPTVTPTATPRPTPTVAPVVAPVPSAPIDCATLASGVRMDLFIPSPVQGRVGLLRTSDAALLESGVLRCEWGSAEQPYSRVHISVSSDRDSGLTSVDGLRTTGSTRAGVGEASAMICSEYGCDASFVAGPWWVEFSSSDVDATSDTVSTETRAANTIVALSSVASQLDGLSATSPWTRPGSSWNQVDGCEALAPEAPLSEILGSPRLEGPQTLHRDDLSGIVGAADRSLACFWSTPYLESAPVSEIADVTVSLSPGSGWAVEAVDSMASLERSPVSVAGADEAEYVCVSDEGSACSVNVVTDGSWLQVSASDVGETNLQAQLVAAAEAILATRPAS